MVPRPDKQILVDLYVNQGKSSTEIGKKLGAHPGSVRKWLKHYGIETRAPASYRAPSVPVEREATDNIQLADFMRKVVSRYEIPYSQSIDGKALYVLMDRLTCGHGKGTARSGRARMPYRDEQIHYEYRPFRLCHVCKRESNAGG